MDAYIFRSLCHALAPSLQHAAGRARIDKFYQPCAGCHSVRIQTGVGAQKIDLYSLFTHSKDFIFPSKFHFSTQIAPPTYIMALRKNFSGKRISSFVFNWLERQLAFGIQQEGLNISQHLWLFVDSQKGFSIFKELPPEFTNEPLWPENTIITYNWLISILTDATIYKTYPIFTPLLRNTLACMLFGNQWQKILKEQHFPESVEDDVIKEVQALLIDLQEPSSVVFKHSFADSQKKDLLCAWPLPQNYCKEPFVCEEQAIIETLEQHGEILISEYINTNTKEFAKEQTVQQKKLQRTLKALGNDQFRLQEMQGLSLQAQLLQMNLYKFDALAHQEHIELVNLINVEQEETVSIALDIKLTIKENMEKMFKLSKKGKRGLLVTAQRIAEITQQLVLSEQSSMYEQIALPATSTNKKTKEQNNKKKSPQQNKLAVGNFNFFTSSDGFTLIRGKNAISNSQLIKTASVQDYWLHVKNAPSAHVLIKRDHLHHEVPQKTLVEAANLAALKSPLKDDTNVQVTVALAKHVQTVKGGKAGQARVLQEMQTLSIKPDKEIEEMLLK